MARIHAMMLGAVLASGLAVPQTALAETSTRVVRCGAASCLLVSGQRNEAAAGIAINGHAVAAQGGRNWRVRLPVATVRAWSKPNARSIAVAVGDRADEAALPIGLLGQPRDLAMLVVRAK